MALDSSSTTSEAIDQYRDNLDWDDTGSLSKAKLFRQALRFLRQAEPSSAEFDGVRLSQADMSKELDRVTAFIDRRSGAAGPSVTRLRPSPRYRG